MARKIVSGLCPSPKNLVNPRPPLAVSQCVSRAYVPTVPAVRCGEEVPDLSGGLAKSEVTSSKIIQHAIQQIDKSVARATAKLATLMESNEKLKAYNIDPSRDTGQPKAGLAGSGAPGVRAGRVLPCPSTRFCFLAGLVFFGAGGADRLCPTYIFKEGIGVQYWDTALVVFSIGIQLPWQYLGYSSRGIQLPWYSVLGYSSRGSICWDTAPVGSSSRGIQYWDTAPVAVFGI